MNKIIFTFLLIFGLSISVNAAERETWLCKPFMATSDKSTYLGPFIMYGNRNQYEFKHAETGWSNVLTFAGEHLVKRFDVYIGIMNNDPKQTEAYYFQKDEDNRNKMKILNFTVPIFDRPAFYFETDCIKQ